MVGDQGEQSGTKFDPQAGSEPEQPKKQGPKLWPIILGLAVLAVAAFALSAAAFSILFPTGPTPSAATATTGPAVAFVTPAGRIATPTVVARPTASPTSAEGSATLAAKVLANTVAVRELPLKQDVPIKYMDRTELNTYLKDEFAEEYAAGELEQEKALYVILDMMDASLDLEQVLLDMLTEQVMGLYKDDSDEMVMVADAAALSTLEEITLSHEYVHALQDQHFDLTALLAEVEDDSDASVALHALVEGDATLAMSSYALRHKTSAQLAELQDEALGYDQEKLFAAPVVLQASLTFPYQQGAAFVTELYQSGGWQAVDDAYARPPRTSEQVIHPEKYLAGEGARAVDLPDVAAALGPGWQAVDHDSLGELGWLIYFVGSVDDEAALAAAAGWGGDRYALYANGDGQYALAALTAWDTPADADEFFATLGEARASSADATVTAATASRLAWSGGTAGHGQARLRGDQVLFVVTPDAAATERVAAKLGGS